MFERQRFSRWGRWAAAAFVALGCHGYGKATAAAPESSPTPAAAPAPAAVTPKTDTPEVAKRISRAFAATVKAVGPSVVRIDVQQEAPRLSQWNPRPFDFGFGPPGFPGMPSPGPMSGTGSGFLIDAAGHIITNSHVVERGAKFKVTLHDGQAIDAKVIGKDSRTDVAVLRLDTPPKAAAVARLGDSNKLEVGQWVLAIGSPLGLEQTVTVGIVSGKGRVGRHVRMSGDRVREYIQTDAKINPGNSGGPLVNLDGEVVGINTLIRVGAGGAYGFAVPINEAYRVAQLLLKDGRVRYPFLGVAVGDLDRLNPAAKSKLGKTPPAKGAFVSDVTPGSPAAKAGIRVGDVITRIDDREIVSSSDVVDQVSSRRIGDTVTVIIVRDGTAQTLRVTLTESPSRDAPAQDTPKLGLSLQNLTPPLAESLGLPPDTRGAVIAEVVPGSVAERAGLQSGEVILEVDRKKVQSADDAVAALRGGGRHLLLVRGAQVTRFVTVGGD